MMLTGTILSRYIFRQTAGAVLLILLSLTGVVWIALALRQLNLVTTQGQDAWVFIQMTLLALPNLMALIAPIALLVASIHVLNRLNGDSELIIVTAGGGTIWNVARPLLLVALMVAAAVTVVNHWAMPWSLRLLREYVIQVRTDLITQVIQPGRFTSPEPNLTFHIRDRAFDGELKGLVMHDGREGKQVSTYLAERGWIVKQDGNAFLLMEDGHILRRDGPTEVVRIIEFKRYAVDLARFEAKQQGPDLKPRERYTPELLRVGADDEIARSQPGLIRSELHERLASPLYPFAFVMLAVAFIGQAQTTRQSRVQAIVAAFVIAAVCRLVGLAGNNIVALRESAVWIVYALPLGAVLFALLVAKTRMQRRPSRLARRLSASLDGLLSSLPGRREAPASSAAGPISQARR